MFSCTVFSSCCPFRSGLPSTFLRWPAPRTSLRETSTAAECLPADGLGFLRRATSVARVARNSQRKALLSDGRLRKALLLVWHWPKAKLVTLLLIRFSLPNLQLPFSICFRFRPRSIEQTPLPETFNERPRTSSVARMGSSDSGDAPGAGPGGVISHSLALGSVLAASPRIVFHRFRVFSPADSRLPLLF